MQMHRQSLNKKNIHVFMTSMYHFVTKSCAKDVLEPEHLSWTKRRLGAIIFKSTDTVYIIFLFYLCDVIRCDVSAVLKMVARNRTLSWTFSFANGLLRIIQSR